MKKIFFVFTLLFTFTSALVNAADVSPAQVNGVTTIDTAKANQLFHGGAAFIDTRKLSDWDAGRIPDAIHLELYSNFTEASLSAEVTKTDAIVCYCNGEECLRSSECSIKAKEWGFTNVYYYRDGFPAWKEAGHPVE